MNLSRGMRPKQWVSIVKTLLVVALGLLFLISLVNILDAGLDMISLLFVFSTGFLFAGIIRMRTRSSEVTRGYSLMSLVSEYRDFVERTVYRIRKGALGERSEEEFEITVCIDELDPLHSC